MKEAIFETIGLKLNVNILEDNSDDSHEDYSFIVKDVIKKEKFCNKDSVCPGDKISMRKRRGSLAWSIKKYPA